MSVRLLLATMRNIVFEERELEVTVFEDMIHLSKFEIVLSIANRSLIIHNKSVSSMQ